MTTRLQAIAEAASELKEALDRVPVGQFKERAVFVAHENLGEALAQPAGMDADEANGILLRALSFDKMDAERVQAIALALVAETQDARAKEIFERVSSIVGRTNRWERLSARPVLALALAVEVEQLGDCLAATTREHIALKEKHARLIDNCKTQGAAVQKQADKIAELEEALFRHTQQGKAERESAKRGAEIEQLRQRLEDERTAHAGANILLETKERQLLAAEKAQAEASEHCRKALDTVLADYGNVLMEVRSALRAFYEGAQPGDRNPFFAMPPAAVGEFERAKRILDLALGVTGATEETLREAAKTQPSVRDVVFPQTFVNMEREIADLKKRHVEKDARIAVMDARIGTMGNALGRAAETLKRGQAFLLGSSWRAMPEDLRLWAAKLVTEFDAAIYACESPLTAQTPSPKKAEEAPAFTDMRKAGEGRG